MARAGQVEGQKPHPRRLHLDPWTGDIVVPVYHVWEICGLVREQSRFFRLEAEDIKACARKVRRRRVFIRYGVKEFLIVEEDHHISPGGGPLCIMDTTGLKFADKRDPKVKVAPFD